MYICAHLHCTYLGSSSLNLLQDMDKCRVMLEGPSAYEANIVHEVAVEGAL